MRRILLSLVLLLAVLGLGAWATLTFAPGRVVALTEWMQARGAGMEAKVIETATGPVHYYEGGEGPVIVMLHGMADAKASFLGAAAELTGTHRVILPDMANHGENPRGDAADGTITAQVAHVDALADALGLESFDLAGNSMGGHTAAAYAILHPGRVRALILVNAAGLAVEGHEVYAGLAPIETEEQFDAVMARVLVNPPSVPGPVKRHLMDTANADLPLVNAMAEAIRDDPLYDLSDRLDAIAAPTLVLWGQEDAVVPLEVGQRYAEGIEGAIYEPLPGAGHSPQLEQAETVGRAIAAFLDETEGRQ